jgi:hypothetical protein
VRTASIYTKRRTEKLTGMTKLHRRFLRLRERDKKFKIRTHSAIIPALAVAVITLYVYENLNEYKEKKVYLSSLMMKVLDHVYVLG